MWLTNPLTKEQEILIILAEECAEVAQECMKGLRFPEASGKTKRRDALTKEIGDLLALIEFAKEINLTYRYGIERAMEKKYEKLKKYSTHLQHGPP